MIYLKTNNRYERKRAKAIFGAGIFVIVLVAALQFFMPHMLPAFFTSIVSPYWRAKFSVESGSLKSPSALLSENEELKRQLSELKLQSETVEATLSENTELKKLLGREDGATSTIPKGRILAAVLTRPPLAPYDELVIDGGKDLGFSTGDQVYAEGNFLIGVVSDVLESTAKVTLFSSPGQRREVLIGPSHAPAFASGYGGGQYSAELPRIVTINEGDMVVTSSVSDSSFGVVNAIISDPAKAFETVLFSSPVNIYQLRWVLVQIKN